MKNWKWIIENNNGFKYLNNEEKIQEKPVAQRLERVDDFDLLIPGDVVETGHLGYFVDGKLKFDFRGGERISIFSDLDWPNYEAYRLELEKAGLE